MVDILHTRVSAGKQTALIHFNKEVDPPKLRRHLKRAIRKAEALAFDLHHVRTLRPIPESPSVVIQDPPPHPSSIRPSSLCHYTIHHDEDTLFYADDIDISLEVPYLNPDPVDNGTRILWPEEMRNAPSEQRPVEDLTTNAFISRRSESLPIAITPITEAWSSSQNQSLREALGFSIIGRNEELVEDLLQRIDFDHVEGFHPFHQAISFLDGSKTCCNIVAKLVSETPVLFSGPTNTAGHTVIDSIFITILKSHTSMAPGEVSSALRGERRFLGEEVDICGRWDADSDCIRALVAAGVPRIPMDWTYKFCHTSALTICHCISMIGFINSYLFDQPSGLFLQNCELCGLGTNLKPSHVVVIIAFHLAQSGAQDENLFGALAVVLCMVASLTDFGETAITLGSFFSEVP